jgi:hypothetical protein
MWPQNELVLGPQTNPWLGQTRRVVPPCPEGRVDRGGAFTSLRGSAEGSPYFSPCLSRHLLSGPDVGATHVARTPLRRAVRQADLPFPQPAEPGSVPALNEQKMWERTQRFIAITGLN